MSGRTRAGRGDPRTSWLLCGMLGALILWVLPGASSASDRGSLRNRSFVSEVRAAYVPIGFRCETRHRAREVSWRNFVIDRVTECLPIASAIQSACAPLVRDSEAHDPGGVADVAARPASKPLRAIRASDSSSVSSIDASIRAQWSADRRRFGNAQHDRSLRALQGVIVRSAR